MEQTIYFEEYEIGSVRESIGRTITETDIVLHALVRQETSFPTIWMRNLQKPLNSGKRIAHGTLTFSIAVGMTANLINPAAFSYGYDHMQLYPSGFHRGYHPCESYLKRKTRKSKAS